MRRAEITGGLASQGKSLAETAQVYMPGNYRVIDRGADMAPLIEGEDVAGWTLDGYVLPRLQSGLIFAREVVDGD